MKKLYSLIIPLCLAGEAPAADGRPPHTGRIAIDFCRDCVHSVQDCPNPLLVQHYVGFVAEPFAESVPDAVSPHTCHEGGCAYAHGTCGDDADRDVVAVAAKALRTSDVQPLRRVLERQRRSVMVDFGAQLLTVNGCAASRTALRIRMPRELLFSLAETGEIPTGLAGR